VRSAEDAGIYHVLAFDKDNNIVGEPLTKTNPHPHNAPQAAFNQASLLQNREIPCTSTMVYRHVV
jgi:hypothetical protein